MDRRRSFRHKRYFPVRFGNGEVEFEAQTRDVSAGGLFVSTRDVQPPGARLWLEVVVEPQRPFFFEGIVVRQLEGPPGQRREAGFAVRFWSAAEVLSPYLPMPDLDAGPPLALSFPSPEALELAVRCGLGGGAVFIWSQQERLPGDRVAVVLDAPFATRTLEVNATVTQTVNEAPRFGLALALDDVHRVTAFVAGARGEQP